MADDPSSVIRRRFEALLDRRFQETVTGVLFEAADKVRAEAFRSISAGSVSGKNHQPSKPGTPPNRDSGNLQAQMQVTMPDPNVARVTSGAGYSAVHEFGSSTHPARPFLRPARDRVRPQAERILNQKLNALKRNYRNGQV